MARENSPRRTDPGPPRTRLASAHGQGSSDQRRPLHARQLRRPAPGAGLLRAPGLDRPVRDARRRGRRRPRAGADRRGDRRAALPAPETSRARRPGLGQPELGWRDASAPLVLFTDNDTLAGPRLLGEHLAWHARTGITRLAVSATSAGRGRCRSRRSCTGSTTGCSSTTPTSRGSTPAGGASTAPTSRSSSGWSRPVGGFDEERLPYLYEDLDFGYRARQLGLRVLYNREAVVEHLRETDLEFWRSKLGRLAERA